MTQRKHRPHHQPKLVLTPQNVTILVDCPECDGYGKFAGKRCEHCEGKGKRGFAPRRERQPSSGA